MFPNDCFYFTWRYFPASGYRRNVDGDLTVQIKGAYSWSSSSVGVDSAKGSFLGARIDNYLHPLREDWRSYGLSVRCVQAFIKDTYFLFGYSEACQIVIMFAFFD